MILEMTTSAIICAGALALPSRGTSETARYVTSQTDRGLNYLQDSIIFGIKPCLDELHQVFEECQNSNWDGYQAEPVTDETYHMALQFLKAMPLGSPSPSIGAEPDGHLTLEWYRSPRRTISLSVSPEGVLHYAALLGGNKAYGSETFFGEVPETIMTLVKRVLAA